MANLFERWASLGAFVGGEINPFEDPEAVFKETLEKVEEEARYLEIMTSWVAKYGHLLLTRKLKFRTQRERRLFSAIVEESQTREPKLRTLIQRQTTKAPVQLFTDLVPILQEVTRKDPNPRFLKQGFYLKNYQLLKEEIVLEPLGVYRRSAILKNRALYGPSLRTDVATVLPVLKEASGRQLAQRLSVTPQTLQPILEDFVQSGLVEWSRKGRNSMLRWMGERFPQAA